MTLTEILAMRKKGGTGTAPATAPAVQQKAAIVPASPKTLTMMTGHGALTTRPQTPDQLTAQARGKALERLKFVRLVDKVSREQLISKQKAAVFVESHYSDLFPILQQAGKFGRSALIYNNYRNWAEAVHGGGTDAQIIMDLADGYATGKRDLKGPTQFWEALRAAWLNLNKLPMTVAYDVAVKRCRQIDPAIALPTFNQAKFHLNAIRRDLVILARDGEVAYKNHCMDYIVRDWSQIAPGALIVGDNRTFDTRVKIWDEAKQKWIAVRPTICAMIDAASWYFSAWAITPYAPNAEIIINTLAQYCAVTGCPPERAYFDNGHDFCARGFSTPFQTSDGSQHSIFQELGISLTNSIAYNARAKTVEMAFHEMMVNFDKQFADYLGSRPGQRTLAADYYDKHPEELPSLQEFTERFDAFLQDWHSRPKKGIIHQGKSPAEIWQSRRPDAAISPEAFRLAFARPFGEYTVTRGPSVVVRGHRYICDALEFGEKVLVKTDPTDGSFIYCFTLRGQFIGTATRREAIAAIAESDDDRASLRSAIRRQYRQLKEAATILHDATGGMHVLSPGELLMLPPDGATLVKLGTVTSVKGAAHHYTRYALPGAEPAPADAPAGKTVAEDQPVDADLQAIISEARHRFEAEKPAERANDLRDYAGDDDDCGNEMEVKTSESHNDYYEALLALPEDDY